MCIAVDLKMLTIKLLFSQWFFLWMVRCFFFPPLEHIGIAFELKLHVFLLFNLQVEAMFINL